MSSNGDEESSDFSDSVVTKAKYVKQGVLQHKSLSLFLIFVVISIWGLRGFLQHFRGGVPFLQERAK